MGVLDKNRLVSAAGNHHNEETAGNKGIHNEELAGTIVHDKAGAENRHNIAVDHAAGNHHTEETAGKGIHDKALAGTVVHDKAGAEERHMAAAALASGHHEADHRYCSFHVWSESIPPIFQQL